MEVLTLDVETTISNKGNPFDLTNKLVVAGFKFTDMIPWDVYLDEIGSVRRMQEFIDNADILVGFNIKFDLHWLRRIGVDISKVKVWDCQIAEFILNNQKTPYPSLDDTAVKYGFEKKLDVVKLEYWDKGIDTDQIPRDVLSAYLKQDLLLTQKVFEKQYELLKNDGRYNLFRLQCQDLLVLEEMEWNGILFNTEKARAKAKELDEQLKEILSEFFGIIGNIPCNLNSNDHVSCILYGGTISVDDRIPIGVYKTGEKTGQTRYKIVTKEYTLPRLVEPLKGTEVKKPEGKGEYWQVNETILRKLKLTKEARKIVNLLNKYAELEKLRGTYLIGYSDLIGKMNWEKDTIHGNLNQTTAITGRLSSTKPNLQNADPTTKIYMESRYP